MYVRDEGEGITNSANLFVPFFTTKPGETVSALRSAVRSQKRTAARSLLKIGRTGLVASPHWCSSRMEWANISITNPLPEPTDAFFWGPVWVHSLPKTS